MRQRHRLILPALASLAVALGVTRAGTRPAWAQDATIPGGTQIFVAPNLWLPGINANLNSRRLPA